MTLLKDLVNETTKVRDVTEQDDSQIKAEEYVAGFNAWLHHDIAPSPPIWNTAMFEASALTVVSYFLAIHGFYEEATALLREVLEGFMTRLCWDSKNDQSQIIHPLQITDGKKTIDYWEWESGRTETYLSTKKIWGILFENSNIKHYQDTYQLKEEIDALLNLLNKYVHGRPDSRHSPGKTRSSLINARFNSEDFNLWFTRLRTIYGFISILSALSYPNLLKMSVADNFMILDPIATGRVKTILDM